MCITSPPYWGLRDYGVNGQLGLEKTPEEYIANMVQVFREVKRVLRDDGTLWVNMGDSYNSPNSHSGPADKVDWGIQRVLDAKANNPRTTKTLKPKDLVGIPWRLAFALQADGWYLRSDIIWAKPNPMPESVTDRPTKSHEYIFLLSKSPRYYFDQEAVREPVAESTIGRGPVDFGGAKGRAYKPEPSDPNFRNGNEQWGRTFDYKKSSANGRNIRTVWEIATQPFPEAHFATFPEELARRCIFVGTSERGVCPKCGGPWGRVVERSELLPVRPNFDGKRNELPKSYSRGTSGGDTIDRAGNRETKTLGWQPSCKCGEQGTVPGIVLDPFFGSGTVGVVAQKYNRRFIGLELKLDYIKMARKRIRETDVAML